jgi:hypothetical protein
MKGSRKEKWYNEGYNKGWDDCLEDLLNVDMISATQYNDLLTDKSKKVNLKDYLRDDEIKKYEE